MLAALFKMTDNGKLYIFGAVADYFPVRPRHRWGGLQTLKYALSPALKYTKC